MILLTSIELIQKVDGVCTEGRFASVRDKCTLLNSGKSFMT